MSIIDEEFKLPVLRYPFPTVISALESDTSFYEESGWLDTYYQFLSDDARRKYKTHALAQGGVYMAPATLDKNHLRPITMFFQWLTIIDDYYELFPLPDLLHIRERVVAAILGDEPLAQDIGFVHVAAQFRREFQEFMPSYWLERLANAFFDYWTYGVIEECPYKRGEITGFPSVERYLLIHEYAIAMYAYGLMVEPAIGRALPEHVFRNPGIQRPRMLLCRIMAIQNDLHSFQKEQARESEMINIVLILRHRNKLSLAEAVDEAVRIHDGYVAELAALSESLPEFGVNQREAEEFIYQMKLMVTGLERWYRHSPSVRYKKPGAFPEPPSHDAAVGYRGSS